LNRQSRDDRARDCWRQLDDLEIPKFGVVDQATPGADASPRLPRAAPRVGIIVCAMNSPRLWTSLAALVVAGSLTSCIVERRPVERPRGCRHAFWVEGYHRHEGHWRCDDRRPVVIVR
jgi:hypothetical protein